MSVPMGGGNRSSDCNTHEQPLHGESEVCSRMPNSVRDRARERRVPLRNSAVHIGGMFTSTGTGTWR